MLLRVVVGVGQEDNRVVGQSRDDNPRDSDPTL
eukprot:COSAG06_NODE_28680_length_570_cov_0.592357_1_plen_32_part_10